MRSLVMNELGTNPAKLLPILEYSGVPITAHGIYTQIKAHMDAGRQTEVA